MHGLIFVTWEKFLAESFGNSVLSSYRLYMGETPANSPLAGHVYDDEQLLIGIDAACRLTGVPTSILLRRYGRYFIVNGLTSHLCAYLLTRVHSGKQLLLVMRDAHAQMRRTPDKLTPPLFGYEVESGDPGKLTLIYDSPRKMCAVLFGAIEGAAERYGEQVSVIERSCMHHGAATCRLEAHFTALPRTASRQLETPEQQRLQRLQHRLADMVLLSLPNNEKMGITLVELHNHLVSHFSSLRLSTLFEAVQHLQYVGLVASTENLAGDDMGHRRYWRVPITEAEPRL
jgi:hypothetical protein